MATDPFKTLTNLFSNPEQENYYADAARRLYTPARELAVSGIAAEKGEAEQQAAQRAQIQGITGPLAEEQIARTGRLMAEAGGRSLNALDEQARQAAYVAAEKDRQEYQNAVAARQQAIFDSFKLGAGLITGALSGWGKGDGLEVPGDFNPESVLNDYSAFDPAGLLSSDEADMFALEGMNLPELTAEELG